MFAFVDETGNTGANIFDHEQPDFFTGALITKSNFDFLYGKRLREICQHHDIEDLHASVLGFNRLEKPAFDLLDLLKTVDARFIISRVEKRYLLATKVFDTFFDSGENPAVPWTAYNIKLLKLILCFRVATLLTDDIAHDFWAMLMANSEHQARNQIPGICDAILKRVQMLPDDRSREIVTDTLSWAHDHPEALDVYIPRRQAKNGHMPNMVAFVNLLSGLEHFSRLWKRTVRKIVHDRQSQFESSLEEWHRLFSNASNEPIHRPGETIVLQMVAGSTFEISSSNDSAGIQIADVVLWLYRQFLAGKVIPEGCARILDYLFRKGLHNDFSFSGVGHQVEEQLATIMAADIPPEKLEAGQRILSNTENNRRRLVALYEEDGLRPYERDPINIKALDT